MPLVVARAQPALPAWPGAAAGFSAAHFFVQDFPAWDTLQPEDSSAMKVAVVAVVFVLAAGILGFIFKPTEDQQRPLTPEPGAGGDDHGHGHHH